MSQAIDRAMNSTAIPLSLRLNLHNLLAILVLMTTVNTIRKLQNWNEILFSFKILAVYHYIYIVLVKLISRLYV